MITTPLGLPKKLLIFIPRGERSSWRLVLKLGNEETFFIVRKFEGFDKAG
jgi:hypothetical protein